MSSPTVKILRMPDSCQQTRYRSLDHLRLDQPEVTAL